MCLRRKQLERNSDDRYVNAKDGGASRAFSLQWKPCRHFFIVKAIFEDQRESEERGRSV